MSLQLLPLFQKLFCSSLLKRNQELEELLERYLPSFRFTFTQRVRGEELKNALRAAFPEADIKIHDAFYDMVKWEELVEWLNKDSLSEMQWIEDIFDCDDFADESSCRMHILGKIQEKNFAYRIAWGDTPMGYHAFCIAYVLKGDDKRIVILEPQNDYTQGWKKSDYKPDFIKI